MSSQSGKKPKRWSTTEDARPRDGDELLHVVGIFGYGNAWGAGQEHSVEGNCCQGIWGFVLGDTTRKVFLHGVEFPHPWPGGEAD